MPNLLRRDPSKTAMLRRQFGAEMKRRFKRIADAVRELIVYDDAFGLIEVKNPLAGLQQVPKQAWRFKTDAAKVKSFRTWLQQQIDAQILTVDVKGKPWTAQYVESAYLKGANRAYLDIHRPDLDTSVDFYKGGMEEFLRTSFTAQTAMSEVEALYTRSFNELKGITDVMSQQMSRILTNGLVHGKGAAFIARELRKNIAGITKTRALVLARTEIVAAQAEGQLTAFKLLGVEKVGIFAEWSTAGDDKVCPLCGELEGVVMPIAQARGLIPRHPNCRCAWLPASRFQKQKGQIWNPKKRRESIRKSVQAELPNQKFKVAKKRSVWAGREII